MTKYFPLLVLALLATPALAGPPAPATSIVRTADLDLSSQAGQRALDRRLSIAVAEVCGAASVADLGGQNEVRRCRVATRQRVQSDRDGLLASSSARSIEVAAR